VVRGELIKLSTSYCSFVLARTLGHALELHCVFRFRVAERSSYTGLLSARGGMGFEKGVDTTFKSAMRGIFDLGNLHIAYRASVAAPAIRLYPRLELPVLHHLFCSKQRFTGPLGFEKHGLAMEFDLLVCVVDLGSEEREVDQRD
jgi:hypothetical protein